MGTKQRLAELKDYAETQAEIVNEHLHNAFTQLCREVVADWHRRYPRHRFRIWEGHGMISTEVSPPLCRLWVKDPNSKQWEDITYATGAECQRGAVAILWREAQDIHDAFTSLDLRVQFMVSEVQSP